MVLGALDEGAAVERDNAGHGGISLAGHLVAYAGWFMSENFVF
jgi:hypothetical protein